jgi:hypothetical protein
MGAAVALAVGSLLFFVQDEAAWLEVLRAARTGRRPRVLTDER